MNIDKSTSAFSDVRYTHDCSECVSLGQHEEYDLYFCSKTRCPTVIARYGNEGGEYTSGLSLAAGDPVLGEARRRAQASMLLSSDGRHALSERAMVAAPSDREISLMTSHGFVWSPNQEGFPRWIHCTGTTATRQPYMSDFQWRVHQRMKIEDLLELNDRLNKLSA